MKRIDPSITVLTATVLSILFGCCSFASESTERAEYEAHVRQKFSDLARKANKDIRFYGIVLDQNDNPVTDVNVVISVKRLDVEAFLTMDESDLKSVTLKTDQDGMFELNDVGKSIYISEVNKEGYEYLLENNPNRGFTYWAHFPKDIFRPIANKPVEFYMRKKGVPAYLIKVNKGLIIREEEPQDFYRLNICLLDRSWIDENYESRRKDKHTDLIFDVNVIEQGRVFDISIVCPDPNSGVIWGDEKLYKAPEDGYSEALSYTFDIPERNKKFMQHLYVKARDGRVRSRIDVEFYKVVGAFYVRLKCWSNPTGSRNLEYDSEYQIKEYDRRKDEKKRRYKEKLRKGAEKERLRKMQKAREMLRRKGN